MDDSEFNSENEALIFERLSCHDDATVCIKDGRGAAAEYFKSLSQKENCNAKLSAKYKLLADTFEKEKQLAETMWSLLSGWENMEDRPKNLANKENRQKAGEYIKQIEVLDKKALATLIELSNLL